MEWPQVATLSVTVMLAFIGYMATYLNNLRLVQRKDRLERVERQLRDFYGPLLSLSESSTRAWQAFRSKYRPGRGYWRTDDQPTANEAAAWRAWMTSVFTPLNEEMARLITAHADLIEEPEMPECLLELYAHIAAYRPVIEQWKTGDFSAHASLLNFPTDSLLKYARDGYRTLKREQTLLLGG